MDVLDSTANFAGLSILSPIAPSDTAGVPPLPATPADFAQQLQALTEVLGDPQALAAELQAAGLIEGVPAEPATTPAAADPTTILAQLSELVARLLQGTEQPPQSDTPTIRAERVTEPVAEAPAHFPQLVKFSLEVECSDAAECPAEEYDDSAPTPPPIALLSTIVARLLDTRITPAPQTTENNAGTPAPPTGLVEALARIFTPPSTAPAIELSGEPQPAPPSEPASGDDDILPSTLSTSTPISTALPVLPAPAAVVVEQTPAVPVATRTDSSVNPLTATSVAEPNAITEPSAEPTASAPATPSTKTKPVEKSSPAAPISFSQEDTRAVRSERDETFVRAESANDSAPESLQPITTDRHDRLSAETATAVPVTHDVAVSRTESHTIPPQDSQKLVERLGRYIVEAQDQGQQLSVQITPPDLGPLRIDVSSQQGQLTARLTTESTVAQQLLQDHLPQLHEALQHLGANVERIDVVRSEPLARDREWDRTTGVGASTDWSASSGQSSPDHREEPRRPRLSTRRTTTETPQTPTAAATGTLQELNIRI